MHNKYSRTGGESKEAGEVVRALGRPQTSDASHAILLPEIGSIQLLPGVAAGWMFLWHPGPTDRHTVKHKGYYSDPQVPSP